MAYGRISKKQQEILDYIKNENSEQRISSRST